jgi:hypothetical protein
VFVSANESPVVAGPESVSAIFVLDRKNVAGGLGAQRMLVQFEDRARPRNARERVSAQPDFSIGGASPAHAAGPGMARFGARDNLSIGPQFDRSSLDKAGEQAPVRGP